MTSIRTLAGANVTKIYRIHQFGGPEVLSLDQVALPEPQVGEAIVRVEAASINAVDFKIRKGTYPAVSADKFPYAMGRDFAGVIETLNGEGCGLHVGDHVYGILGFDRGAYAERIIVKVGEMALRPMELSATQAAAVPLAALTAWQGLFDQGRLSSGQRVLIHGAAGGVGHFAIQLAKACGASVYATASGDGTAFIRQFGVEKVIDYRQTAFEEVINNGYLDLVLDLVGGDTLSRSWSLVREGGALISAIEEPSGHLAESHNIRAASYLTHPSVTQLKEIATMLNRGVIRAMVTQTHAFEAAGEAHRRLENKQAQGKSVIEMTHVPEHFHPIKRATRASHAALSHRSALPRANGPRRSARAGSGARPLAPNVRGGVPRFDPTRTAGVWTER